jgi:hypothetical protein
MSELGHAQIGSAHLRDDYPRNEYALDVPAPKRAVMSHESGPKGPSINIAAGSSEQAPFVYFDGVLTYGMIAGVVQLELAANIVLPASRGTRTDLVITAHLRCSPGAALSLRDTINRMLEMTGIDQTSQPVPHSKAN